MREALIEQTCAFYRLADRLVFDRPQQSNERQVVGSLRAWHPSPFIKDPPRQLSVIDPQHPAFAAAEVHEHKLGVLRTYEHFGGVDGRQIGHCRVVG